MLPPNEIVEIRSTVARESRTIQLRTWVLKLLEDRTELEKQLRAAKPPGPPPSLGVITSQKGREEEDRLMGSVVSAFDQAC